MNPVEQLKQNEEQYRSSSYSAIIYNNNNKKEQQQHQQKESVSFNEYIYYPLSDEPLNVDPSTPICSDNEDLFISSNINDTTPGAKQWYMSFPSDNDEDENKINSDKLKPTKSMLNENYSNNSFGSFDIGMPENFCYENLQQQQTDIFSSTTYNALNNDKSRLDKTTNQLYSEGINKKEENITMMGYINSNCSLGLRSKIYSEGNIIINENDEYESDQEILNNDEGTNDEYTKMSIISQMNDDELDNDEMDNDEMDEENENEKKQDDQPITLMGGPNDGYQEEQDDDELLGNLNGPITLMGGDIAFEHKISFKAFEDDINNNKENEIEIENEKMKIKPGITLMGHFDHEIDENQKNKISFKNQNSDYEMILFE